MDPGSGFESVVSGQVLRADGSYQLKRRLEVCEPALGPEKAPEHRVSLESNERNLLPLYVEQPSGLKRSSVL